MTPRRRGGVLPAVLFLSLACCAMALFFSRAAAIALDRQRGATAADFAVLTAMRVRRQSLESIADRWLAFGGDIAAGPGGLEVAAGSWPAVRAAAESLRRAVPGYQGRVTSALTVALDANAFPRDAARAVSGDGLRLGVVARTEIVSVDGIPTALPGAWYARTWRPADAAPVFADGATLRLDWPVAWLGSRTAVPVAGAAALEWDADPSGADFSFGRGGFARALAEGLSGGAFLPHRLAVFRARQGGAS